MRLVFMLIVALVSAAPQPVAAEPRAPHRVVVDVSQTEIRAPGMVGVTMHILDEDGHTISVNRVPENLDVRFTLDGAPVVTELWSRDSGTIIEADLTIRRSGWRRVGARVQEVGTDVVVLESESVVVMAVTPLDYGVVRAGETICRELPGGGRGLIGEVVDGTLPENLDLWGACLVAGDSVDELHGDFRASVAVLSGSGQGRRVDRRLYDITYQLEPRLLTPRRVLYGFSIVAVLVMIMAVASAVRRRLPAFGPGTVMAYTRVEGSPYRGDHAVEWRFVDLSSLDARHGAIDIAALIGKGGLDLGLLKVRPTSDGLVEFIGPRNEELRAVTPDDSHEIGHRRLRVPYGSMVSFRDMALSPMIVE